jgi:glycine/D-amino acid oxidase-like deaminating enzyme
MPEAWNEKKAFQLESLLLAQSWWAEVSAASGLPTGYARTGRLQPLVDAAAVVAAERRASSAATLWQGRAVWAVVPATGDPWEPTSPSGQLVRDTLSARLHPRLALAALARAIATAGGEIVLAEAPETGAVVHATGRAGLDALSADLGRPVGSGVKGQAVVLAHDAGEAAQLMVDGLHIVPHVGGRVAVGSTSETTWQGDGPDGLAEGLVARARAACPALARANVVERWAGIRPRSQSRAPILGEWPGRSGHFIANGGFKIGFGMAPLVAEVMADLLLEGQDRIPSGFRPEASLGRPLPEKAAR